MKADQKQYGHQGLALFQDIARRTVKAFVQTPKEQFLAPKVTTEWTPE
jgi:hypothetical protein